MKTVTNVKLIKRNAKIGQYTSLGALVVLGIGLYITFKMPDKFAYSLAALLIGFFMSQVGMHFTNRWGRNPRPDDIIDKSLKGSGTGIHHLSLCNPGLASACRSGWHLDDHSVFSEWNRSL